MTPSPATPTPPGAKTLWRAVPLLAACVTAAVLAGPLLSGSPAWYLADVAVLAMSAALARLYVLRRAETRELAQRRLRLEQQVAGMRRDGDERTARDAVLQARLDEMSARHEAAVTAVEWLVAAQPETFAGRPVPPLRRDGAVAPDPRLEKALATGLEGAAAAGRDHQDILESQQLTIVALARRVQSAMHRVQAEAAMTAERNRDLPEVYLACQTVDHLAAQAARLAQGLAVACGTWEGQQWDTPMRLAEVVQAAQARIEDFQRVSVEGDPDVAITPMALEAVIHVMAELLANATESSPTATTVSVKVTAAAQGAVFRVDDHGAGLEEPRLSQARDLLSGARELTLAEMGEVPRLGLPVVARYVRRHGFKVTLDESPYGGLQVVVPAGLRRAEHDQRRYSGQPGAPARSRSDGGEA
ncbi:ATP-binding protein, partial [Actinomadura roseirufa]|uniref:ATP-binding protein n=1 Tax=Actinomadura roseirufa TaxID=2094049 RepID=UPI0013F153D6